MLPNNPPSKLITPRRSRADIAIIIQPMSGATKFMYCLMLASLVFPLGMSGWVSLTVGGGALSFLGLLGKYAIVPWLLLALLAAARIWRVMRDPNVLSAYVYSPFQNALLRVATFLLYVVGVAFVLRLFSSPLAALLLGAHSGGIGAYAIAVWFSLFAMAGPLALALFEYSRLLGFEYVRRNKGSADAFLITQPLAD